MPRLLRPVQAEHRALASSSLAEVMALTPVSFQYTPRYNGALQRDPNFSGTFVGFIAEDVAKIDPRLITVDATGTTPTGPTRRVGDWDPPRTQKSASRLGSHC
jgi:hypothetical protein